MNDIAQLEAKARQIRLSCLKAGFRAGKVHLGGTFSCLDVLVALYYCDLLRFDRQNPDWDQRDRFILSKGHASLAIYAIFNDLGLLSDERFQTYAVDGGLGGQLNVSVPGVDWNTGSLGHGVGVCAGMALAAKIDGRTDAKVVTVLGDAECDEGSIWEAVPFAATQNLDNLIVVIDRNRLAVTEVLDNVGPFRDFPALMESWGWACHDIDGHSFPAIIAAFEAARKADHPTVIVANTIKGKGVSFMENELRWHYGAPSRNEYERAVAELGGQP